MSEYILLVGLGIGLLIAAFTDIRESRIPNWLTGSLAFFGVSVHTIVDGWPGFLFSVQGMAIGLLCLIFFYIKGGMGAGDVKLLAAIGAVLGTVQVVYAFCFAALLGGGYSFMLLVATGGFRHLWERLNLFFTMLLCSGTVNSAKAATNAEPKLRYALVLGLGTVIVQTLILYELL